MKAQQQPQASSSIAAANARHLTEIKKKALMENASGDLRRALGGPILGRQLLEVTHQALEEFAELDAHN